jgi:alkanesulfonate monooxygenase SsuD/methylene tetrahydromethanopterin reductase-like flavin-dependent oxidoreductase (luciferase family)
VVEYGDGWIPILGRGPALEDRMQELRQMAAEAGREPIPVTIWNARPEPEFIERMAGLGATRCVFGLPAAGADDVLPRLERYAEVMSATAAV